MARWRPHVPVDGLRSIGPTHATAGLAGYPARDYFARAGQSVRSPIRGTVVKLSGHDPSEGPPDGVHGPFGWSVYIRRGRRTYYLTHLGARSVRLGDHVKRGQKIGTVGDYSRWGGVDHVHVGLNISE